MAVETIEYDDPDPDSEQIRLQLNQMDRELSLLLKSFFPSGRDQREHIKYLQERIRELRQELEQNPISPKLLQQVDTLRRNIIAIQAYPPEDIELPKKQVDDDRREWDENE